VRAAAGGALGGLRDARGPLLILLAAFWGVGLPAGLLLAPQLAVPTAGVWGGLVLGQALAMGLYLVRFRALTREGSAITGPCRPSSSRPCSGPTPPP
jgi:multidrug resistance protein, MATE family